MVVNAQLLLLLPVLLVTAAGPAADQQASDSPPAADKSSQSKATTPDQVRLDLYGDPLPPGAIARLGTIRFRAPAEAQGLAFAPDGKTIAVTAYGGLFLFDAGSGKRIKRLAPSDSAHRRENSLVFSPDGKRLAARGTAIVGDGKDDHRVKGVVRVWELAAERKPRDYDAEHTIWLGWSADGEPLAVCLETGGVRLHELAARRSRRFDCPDLWRPELSDYVLCAACAPAGRALAVADEQNVIHVWDTATGKERCTVRPEKKDYFRGLAVSLDGGHLALLKQESASPYRHAVQILDAITGRFLRTVAADQKNISTVAFAPDGKTLATAGWSGIRFWDVATGRERSRSEAEGSNTERIAFSADGKTLATLERYSPAFHLWDVPTGQRKPEPVGHRNRPHGTAFSPDGRRLATGGELDGTIHVWDLASSESLFKIHRQGDWVRGIALSADGRSLFSIGTNDNLWVCDAATGERQHIIKLDDPERPDTYQSAISMNLSADAKTLVAFSYYHTKKDGGPRYEETLITGWDPATRKQLFRRRIPGREEMVVSANARLLAIANPFSPLKEKAPQQPMRLENLATGEPLLAFSLLEGQTWALAFSPDSRLLAAYNSNYKRLKKDDPTSTASSLVLWEVATASEVLSLPLAGQPRAAFSPDGRLLAIPAPLGSILVWDLAQGGERRRFQEFDGEVTWLAFSPDSRRLISGHADSTLLVWEVPAPPSPRKDKLGPESLARAWTDLASADAPRAFRARWALASAPEAALPLLAKHLQPARPADPKRLGQLLADLDSPQFAVRTAAQKGLEELGELATPALRQMLAKNPSLELRRRAETLLDKLRGPVTGPERRRAARALAVLEATATPEARKLLATLAQGAPEARLTQEARVALERLRQQPPH